MRPLPHLRRSHPLTANMSQRVIGLEIAAKAGLLAATCDDWTPFNSQACAQVVIYNISGVDLRVCYLNAGGTGPLAGQTYLVIPAGVAQPMRGLKDASQLGLKRDSGSGSVNATIYFEAV